MQINISNKMERRKMKNTPRIFMLATLIFAAVTLSALLKKSRRQNNTILQNRKIVI